MERRIAAGNKVNGALAALMRRRNVSTAARLAVHNAAKRQKKNERKMNVNEGDEEERAQLVWARRTNE